MNDKKIVVLHNIISPYKTLLFNELAQSIKNFTVLYISETEHRREWNINRSELNFRYKIMFDASADDIGQRNLYRKTCLFLNDLNPDVLIIDGYSYASCWAGLLWAKRKRKKVILWSSSNQDDHKRVFYKEFIKSLFIRNCDAYNVYGIKSRNYLLRLGAKEEKIFSVGNNTDNRFYYNETSKWRIERTSLIKHFGVPERNFLYTGRLSEEKNILYLLDAYKRLKSQDEWGLILLGNGPQREEIISYLQCHSIKNVLMPGFIQKDDIPKYMAVCDMLILPSISEPWGIVVNESMAAGLPVLVSNRCGCSEDLVKEGDNGYSFDPYNSNRLFELMSEMTSAKVDLRRMGERSLELIKEFTPQRAAKIIIDTIETVVGT